jgi:hypothetical protein
MSSLFPSTRGISPTKKPFIKPEQKKYYFSVGDFTRFAFLMIRSFKKGEDMPDKGSCNSLCSAKSFLKSSITFFVLPACWLLIQGGSGWGQQSRRENIYLDGKLVSVETSSVTPLAVNITSPTSNPTYITNSSPITLGGSLSGNTGTTQVSWTNDRGSSGTCSGTTSWTCSGVTLFSGSNSIVVTAQDSAFNSGGDVLTVAYCASTISPTSTSIGGQGGTGSVSVTCASGCAWTATGNSGWITITGGSSGNGNGTVSYSVAANTGPARNGIIIIAGQAFAISQAAVCIFSISPTQDYFPHSGGTGNVSVTCASGCAWTATSNNTWITVTQGSSGNGNGLVRYSVSNHFGSPGSRDGTITIAGQTFTVHQD